MIEPLPLPASEDGPRLGVVPGAPHGIDALTGLVDRDHFLERAGAVLHSGGGLKAVILLDIDGLRRINQGLGSAAGDEVLEALAQRLMAASRKEDVVARVGGDEFAVLLAGLGEEDEARVLATRLAWAVEHEYSAMGHRLPLRVSMGVAVGPHDSRSAEKLLSDAEAAMYAAKSGGGDARVVVYSDSLREQSQRRFALEAALRRAVDNNAFELWYQPQVALSDRHVIATEALLRWQDENRGWLPPADFIPVAEDTGLIVPLGHWVIDRATAQLAEWIRKGYKLNMSINVSAKQLADPDFIFQVRDLLTRSGVPARSVTLEITESQVLRNLEITLPAMLTLRNFGVRLAIDDFGTGYASLTQLKTIPADELKLDRSFIVGLEHDPRDRGVVEGAVQLAHSLGLTVVAEGVETFAQLNFLTDIGCDALQGFLLGKPQPADEVSLSLSVDSGAATPLQ
ncbi:MAG: bifunctional diguanylate cyclase/phosphodiesterase [Candidatus Dormibacteraeota bacterium]|nr:bifunctional diguanylate cyclase/phosphodiesterase [Candidatus Dormibacteraeota bacterium]